MHKYSLLKSWWRIVVYKPKRPCGSPGCRKLAQERYCEDHLHLAEQQRKKRHKFYDKYQRDQQAAKFYKSQEWEAARLEALTRDLGLCQHCKLDKRITLADMVHHRFPVRTHWHIRLLLSNLVSLCNGCHAKIDHERASWTGNER